MNVLTIGTFDIPHMGHAAFLKQAAALGDELIVGVLSDEFVRRAKGEYPLFRQREREALVGTLGYRTYIELGVISPNLAHPTQALILSPCIVAVGSDWMHRDYLDRLGISNPEDFGITIAYIPYTEGISTTEIVERTERRKEGA